MEHPIVTGRQSGFTYIALLMWVALTGAALGALGEIWSTAQRRDREAELLFIGAQIQSALERYGASGRFPKKLEELLGDEKSPLPRRYLRRLYPDPMTRSTNWGTMTLSDGQIIGVYSRSEDMPLKTGGFSGKDLNKEKKLRYSDWAFVATNAPKTGQAGVAGVVQAKPK